MTISFDDDYIDTKIEDHIQQYRNKLIERLIILQVRGYTKPQIACFIEEILLIFADAIKKELISDNQG